MAEQDKPELIIVRRRGVFEQAEGKNSVWKIAYADFMTAMMAFFLVMWLISATNQETRESVASYFNPIKLADSTPDRKGLNDARRVDPGKAEEDDSLRPLPEPGKSAQAVQRPQAAQPRNSEAALFRDPYAVLSEIAGAPPRIAQVGTSLDADRQDGLKGGEAYRDPFDPIYWQMSVVSPLEKKALGTKEIGSLPFDEDLAALSEGKGPRPSEGKPDATAAPPKPGMAKVDQAQPDQANQAKTVGAASVDAPKESATANGTAVARVEATQKQTEAEKLQSAVSAALSSLGSARPVAEVRETNEGLLINLTDDVNYGMFAIGSAEPTPGLVRALDKITPLISQRPGQVIVRGHTDNRPFRSLDYDNWRLSTARAHMAYHMLLRGGLDARRVERIEGYADRRPKVPEDPAAAPNRRIEILIRAPSS
ncbi:MotB family protein [Microbacteriaceae bacterium K1510]|nr:MotB family protein [Microbacteriaceae bacterium K1510]